jgi:hypothetical protein
MRTVRIASLYPIAQRAQRPLYGGDFNLTAVKRGDQPAILDIKDHFQFEPQPYFTGLINGKQRKERKLVLAIEIAQCLLREWTIDNTMWNPECHPGIWIVRDTIALVDANSGVPELDGDGKPAVRDATEAEKKAMWDEDHERASRAQATWVEAAVTHGNIMAENPKAISFIPKPYKVLAVAYGYTPKWLNRSAHANTKPCPWCQEQVPTTVIYCPKCTRCVDPQRAATVQAEQDAIINRHGKGVMSPAGKSAA